VTYYTEVVNLHTRIADFLKKEYFVLVVLTRMVIVLFLVVFFSYPVTHYFEVKFFNAQVVRATYGLSAEEAYVSGQIQTIATSPGLKLLVQAKDIPGINLELTQKQTVRDLTAMNVTDAHGLVLSRTNMSSRNGDYIFQTTNYGRDIAEGATSTVSIGPGTNFPLMMLAGAPMLDGGKMIAAVFGGYVITDAYANDFKTKYLGAGEQLIFYSNKTGVVASTFTDPGTKNIIAAYFNTGSDWIQKQETNRDIIIGGKSYLVKNVSFPSIQGVPSGGILILSPDYFTTEALLFAICLMIILIVLTCVDHIFRLPKKYFLYECITIVASFIVIVVGGFVIDYSALFSHVVLISKPPQAIYNSTINLSPSSGILNRSFSQNIAVAVSTGGETINAAQVDILYDPTMLQIERIDTANSLCAQNMFFEKTIDNKKGEVRVQCLDPAPSFSGENGTIVTLVVQPLKTGWATLHFEDTTRVLANDGLGTDVLRMTTDSSYQIIDTAVAASSVLVFSPTHPNSSEYYNTASPIFTWVSHPGYQYLYFLDTSATTTSLATATSTTADSVLYTNLADGNYYFHIASIKDGIIGPLSTYKIMVDTTLPPPPIIKESQTTSSNEQIIRLEFSDRNTSDADDIKNDYYVKFDDGVFLPTVSPLFVSLPTGKHTITLRVFDRAGNFSDSAVNITVTN
jgi:Cohesin domain